MNQKATVYLEPAEHLRLKEIAAAAHKPTTAIIREAVSEYVARHPAPPLPAGVLDPSDEESAEELLKGSGPG